MQDVVARLDLNELLDRMPRRLSGGQARRVAIARALLAAPQLLLLDEPLTALDWSARERIIDYLREAQRELQIPCIYVTHSPTEVARVGDEMIWLRDGRVHASGAVPELMGRIETGSLLGETAASVILARVVAHDERDHLTELDSPWGKLWVRQLAGEPGEEVRVHVRAGDVSLSREEGPATSILNVLHLEILELAEPRPGEALLRLGDAARPSMPALLARITTRSRDALSLSPGVRVIARVKSVSLMRANEREGEHPL